MKAIVLIGGISKGSLNRRFFEEIEKCNDTSVKFTIFDISTLPFYSQDIENNPPQSVVTLKELVISSDSVMIVTPEYNRSIPAVLKNAIDWGSRIGGQNIWAGKPTAITGASSGPIGTFGAQQHLRAVCTQLNMHVMDQPAMYLNASTAMDEKGLTEKSTIFVKKFLAAFEKWIATFSPN